MTTFADIRYSINKLVTLDELHPRYASPRAADQALIYLSRCEEQGYPVPQIMPEGDGDISLTWTVEGWRIFRNFYAHDEPDFNAFYLKPFGAKAMTDAPERIWIDPGAMEVVQGKAKPEYDIQYVRADVGAAKMRWLVDALRPFAEGAIDTSASAVIVGYPECETALNRARDALEDWTRP